MLNRYISRLGKVLALSACLSFGLAMAQSEPTLTQIYDAAKIGNVDKAQVMVQQVLIAHPNSARAHFVQAELFARQGQMSRGRESLQAAEKLAPGLPFAKAEAVQALRAQLTSRPTPAAQEPAKNNFGSSGNNGNSVNNGSSNSNVSRTVAPAPASSGFPLGLGLALGGAAIALVIFLTRKKTPDPSAYVNQGVNPNSNFNAPNNAVNGGNGLSGPQTFGAGQPSYGQAPYGQPGQPGYGQQPAYGQPPAGNGMGGRIAGGLATGLAVGAGVMAAEAIGKNMMGGNAHAAVPPDQSFNNLSSPAENNGNAFSGNNDMGGNDFGMNDTGSWDDGGSSADNGGGGDWDT